MTIRERISGFWFAPGSPVNLGATRIVVAATGLWMVLSRFDLPSVVAYPAGMWSFVTFAQKLRFGYILPLQAEQALWVLLHVTLVMALIGLWPRLSCLVSGVLLYHFGPLEAIFWTTNPYLRGFTIPVLALVVLGFSRCGDALAVRRARGEAEPGDYNWPLLLIQVFFVQIYFFAAYAKLFTSGFEWISAENIRHYLLLQNQYLGFARESPGYMLASYPLLCGAIAWAGMVFEVIFPAVLFWPRSRRVLVPMALFFHVANAVLFHIIFQNAVLLLLFVNWEWVAGRVRSALPAPVPAAEAAR